MTLKGHASIKSNLQQFYSK